MAVDANLFIDDSVNPTKLHSDLTLREGITSRIRGGSNVANFYLEVHNYQFSSWSTYGTDRIYGTSGEEAGDDYGITTQLLDYIDSFDISHVNCNTASVFNIVGQWNSTASSVYFEQWFEKEGSDVYNYVDSGANEYSFSITLDSGGLSIDAYGGFTYQSVDINSITEADIICGFHIVGNTFKTIIDGSVVHTHTSNDWFDLTLYQDNLYPVTLDADWTKTLRVTVYIPIIGGTFYQDDVSFDAKNTKQFYIANNAVGTKFYTEFGGVAAFADALVLSRNYLYKTTDDVQTITLPDPPNSTYPSNNLGSAPTPRFPSRTPPSPPPPPPDDDPRLFNGTFMSSDNNSDGFEETVILCTDGDGCHTYIRDQYTGDATEV